MVSTSAYWSAKDAQGSTNSINSNQRSFIGGSDARIILGEDEAALVRLWRETRRGHRKPVGQPHRPAWSGDRGPGPGAGAEANTGQVITDVQQRVFHPALKWMAATLDGRVGGSDAVFEAKFMLPVVVLRRSGGNEVHAAAAAQYVGGGGKDRGALGDYGGRQVGRDFGPCRSALSAPHCHRRAQVLALCRERRGTKTFWH